MKVGIHAGGMDMDKLIAYCDEIGVDQVCLACSSISGYEENGYPDREALKEAKGKLEGAGIWVPTMIISRWPGPDALLCKPEGRGEFQALLRTIDHLGEVGVGSVLMYPNLDAPEDDGEKAEHWKRVTQFYEGLVEQAERSGVRIGSHAYYHRGKLIRGYRDLKRLIDEVPSPYNGVTYCPGGYIAEDDMFQVIDTFKDRIAFAHARDVKGRWEEMEEVFLGEGDVDLPGLVRKLQKTGYDGIICPEHLGAPKVEGEDLQARAVTYLKVLLCS